MGQGSHSPKAVNICLCGYDQKKKVYQDQSDAKSSYQQLQGQICV